MLCPDQPDFRKNYRLKELERRQLSPLKPVRCRTPSFTRLLMIPCLAGGHLPLIPARALPHRPWGPEKHSLLPHQSKKVWQRSCSASIAERSSRQWLTSVHSVGQSYIRTRMLHSTMTISRIRSSTGNLNLKNPKKREGGEGSLEGEDKACRFFEKARPPGRLHHIPWRLIKGMIKLFPVVFIMINSSGRFET